MERWKRGLGLGSSTSAGKPSVEWENYRSLEGECVLTFGV